MGREEGAHNSVLCADKTFFGSDSEYPVVVLSVSSSDRVVSILDGDTIDVLHNNCTFANGFQRSTTFAA